eukprot:5959468-Prymnesium_polylepis.2
MAATLGHPCERFRVERISLRSRLEESRHKVCPAELTAKREQMLLASDERQPCAFGGKCA